MEHFQWVTTQKSYEIVQEKREQIEHEVADIAILVLMFCAENNIDLTQAIEKKMHHNAEKYPVEKSK